MIEKRLQTDEARRAWKIMNAAMKAGVIKDRIDLYVLLAEEGIDSKVLSDEIYPAIQSALEEISEKLFPVAEAFSEALSELAQGLTAFATSASVINCEEFDPEDYLGDPDTSFLTEYLN